MKQPLKILLNISPLESASAYLLFVNNDKNTQTRATSYSNLVSSITVSEPWHSGIVNNYCYRYTFMVYNYRNVITLLIIYKNTYEKDRIFIW